MNVFGICRYFDWLPSAKAIRWQFQIGPGQELKLRYSMDARATHRELSTDHTLARVAADRLTGRSVAGQNVKSRSTNHWL